MRNPKTAAGSRSLSRAGIASVTAAAIVAAALLAGGCGGGASEKLRELKHDPVAQYAPAGGRLIDSGERDEGTSLGKPVYASYRRLFQLPAGEPTTQLRRAVDAAEAAGWEITDREPYRSAGGNLVQQGRKQLPTGRAELGITVFPKGPPSGRTNGPAMLILLSHSGS